MSALAAIHVAKKQLGLDDETYRAMLEQITGKSSAKDLTEAERQRVVEQMRKRGFTKAMKGSRTKLEGRFAKKLQALWIAGWNLGVVEDRDDAALVAFVKRQTGIDHVRFVRDPEDAHKAIEAIKAWLGRVAGVDWSQSRYLPLWTQENGYRIASAQWRLLRKLEPALATYGELAVWVTLRVDASFQPWTATDAQWIAVMNALGERLREAKKAVP